MVLVRGHVELDAVEHHSLMHSACCGRDAVGWRMERGRANTEGKLVVKLLELSLKSSSESVLRFLFVNFFSLVFLQKMSVLNNYGLFSAV